MFEISYKMSISDLKRAKISRVKGLESPVLETPTGIRAFRVNVLGVVTGIIQDGREYVLSVEDGSGSSISVLTTKHLKKGDLAVIIGPIRLENEEKLIKAEILRKIDDPNWITLRRLELSEAF